jgi:hypothetical protein
MNRQSPRSFLHAFTASLLVTVLGCSTDGINGLAAPRVPGGATLSARTETSFTIGPLNITGLEQRFPSDRWQLRDVQLSGPVTGSLAGTASLTLNANLDAILGSGPTWGTATIVTTSGETWQGAVTGNFQSGFPNGIQLFSHVVLRGPDGRTIKAECDETSVTSETLACTGEQLTP